MNFEVAYFQNKPVRASMLWGSPEMFWTDMAINSRFCPITVAEASDHLTHVRLVTLRVVGSLLLVAL